MESKAQQTIQKHVRELVDKHTTDDTQREFAEWLVQHPEHFTEVQTTLEDVLEPTPINYVPRVNRFIDLKVGMNAFWEEMAQKPEELLDAATQLSDTLTCIHIGLNDEHDPTIRRHALNQTGLSDEMIDELIPVDPAKEPIKTPLTEEQRAEWFNELGLPTIEPIVDEPKVPVISENDLDFLNLVHDDQEHVSENDLDFLNLVNEELEPPIIKETDLAFLSLEQESQSLPFPVLTDEDLDFLSQLDEFNR